jgi:hypothetical protein
MSSRFFSLGIERWALNVGRFLLLRSVVDTSRAGFPETLL